MTEEGSEREPDGSQSRTPERERSVGDRPSATDDAPVPGDAAGPDGAPSSAGSPSPAPGDCDDPAPGRDPDGEWRTVDADVGLRDEPWWVDASDGASVPPGPDDDRWRRPDDDPRERPVEGVRGVSPPPERGWFASLDRAQRLAILGVAATAVLVALFSLTYALVLGSATGPRVEVPQATFDASYDDAALELTLTHSSGDAVAVDRLTVHVDGEPHRDWTAAASDGRLAAGDELRVHGVQPGATVTVSYVDEDGEPVATVGAADA